MQLSDDGSEVSSPGMLSAGAGEVNHRIRSLNMQVSDCVDVEYCVVIATRGGVG